ncbi:multidrug effflux MFS transporter [Candidatus Halocynthiibacter alkanivorans]|uniref:multidrug effflux MFS transporter n=1 Tax=Candidatus Halocynthiibacter alkanivorans TaxID=2267619 RepID=UPI000DF292CE|nr:multidrug effflux MFS transporter [Candidatus Halocynthiibacter alkanivorans]
MSVRRLSQIEFIALLAMLYAVIAFSIDAMLPSLPAIAAELSPDDLNRAQLVLTSFVMGMGLGTFVTGPLSDAFGRKTIITAGMALYILGAVMALLSNSLELLLVARVLQGFGAAGPRIVGVALIRDLYQGRQMARITSFVFMVFMIVPAIAPALGAVIAAGFGWRAVFVAFVIFALIGATWLNLRQSETLPRADRRPFRISTLWNGCKEVLSNKMVLIYIAAMTLGYAVLFGTLSSVQQIYTDTYGEGDNFPLWFALTAVLAASGTFINASLVVRVGMRKLALWAFSAQALSSGVILLVALSSDTLPFWYWFAFVTTVFFFTSLTFGNLNALALQYLGHIAGLAASVIGGISTVLAVLIAAPIGLAFDGTAVPLLSAALICASGAAALMKTTVEHEPDAPKDPAAAE